MKSSKLNFKSQLSYFASLVTLEKLFSSSWLPIVNLLNGILIGPTS